MLLVVGSLCVLLQRVGVGVLLGVGVPGLKSFKTLVSRDTVIWWL
jgi:hypothetical protein